MPQFDPTTFSAQLFWLFITFALFYGLLQTVIIPRMSQVLQNRWEQTDGHVKKSDDLMAEAEQLSKDYEEVVQAARLEAQAILAQAHAAHTAELQKAKTRILKQIDFKRSAEEQRLASEKNQLLEEATAVAGTLVEAVYKRATESDHPLLQALQRQEAPPHD